MIDYFSLLSQQVSMRSMLKPKIFQQSIHQITQYIILQITFKLHSNYIISCTSAESVQQYLLQSLQYFQSLLLFQQLFNQYRTQQLEPTNIIPQCSKILINSICIHHYSILYFMKLLLILAISICILASQTTPQQTTIPEMTIEQKMLAEEKTQSELIQINYDHIQTYSSELRPNFPEEFTFKVADDHHIKGALNSYINKNGFYTETSYVPGEEIYLQVFEDGQKLLVQKQCYHQMSFQFFARKGHKYYLKFITATSPKAIVFVMQNFVSEGHVQQILKSEHVGEHANRTKLIKEHLTSYLSVIQRHSLFTDRIAHQVESQTSKFLVYQWFQMLVVLLAAVAQVYFVRKMLNTQSII